MLRATGIQKSYENLQVLKGIDLDIQPGESLAIVGPSGAGKTTLLHILATLDKPSAGEIWFEQTCLQKLSEKKLAFLRNQNFGFVFQFHNLLPEFSALENVSLPALIAQAPLPQARQRAEELLHTLGLADRLYHKPSELSGGQQQRVAVARALINQPKVLFADEPSGNLDEKNAEKLHELFFDLKEKMGLTLIVVTHNLTLAQQTQRTIKIIDGQLSKD
ncbi:MAG: ABC transporter ATP-binding protein [Bernardetiaceae bacterium]